MKHVHQVPPQAMDADGNQLETTALFVADLELNVTDSQLYHEFSRLGQVLSVRLCRDKEGKSLGYGYVNYVNPQDAANALKMLNSTPINEKRIFIMHSNCDPSVPRSGPGNIFIKNLDKAIDHNDLYDTFSSYGKILSCKLVRDPSGQSKGYGFVQYDSDEAAQEAIEKVDGTLLNDKQVFVEPYLTKKEREEAKLTTVFLEIRSESDELKSFGWTKYDSDEAARKVAEKLNGMPLNGEQVLRAFLEKQKFTNVFVKNLSESTTKEHLKDIFGKYGRITSAVVMSNADGTSRCFGFVNFKSADDAAQSVKSLNGRTFDNKEWYVGKAQKKSERERELEVRFEQSGKEAADKSQRLNLYIENLDDSIGDDSLKEMFSPFGTITSYKVMRDPHGISKGSGYVAFSTPEEASRALSEMNGKTVVSKPLYVAPAQQKEDQRAEFSQMRPVARAPAVAPRMPMYPPGGPALGQQIFYGQAPPAIMPPQPGFGYQQQLLPGMSPGGPPMPNFFVPMVQQGQHPGGGRGGPVPVQQGQQPLPFVQQQGIYCALSHYLRDAGVSQPISIGAFSSALANASPSDQRTMLGENLYPLVEQLEPEYAAKITGMLLEMDKTEVLHLLESPEALRAEVAEAMEVLRNVQQQQVTNPAHQLAALPFYDGILKKECKTS